MENEVTSPPIRYKHAPDAQEKPALSVVQRAKLTRFIVASVISLSPRPSLTRHDAIKRSMRMKQQRREGVNKNPIAIISPTKGGDHFAAVYLEGRGYIRLETVLFCGIQIEP